ncbi:MAG: DUF1684 domain-containing protein [Anaerolineales bacterium]|nr:DUF1684 domain-containing protein [Anaerolineales bacterium]
MSHDSYHQTIEDWRQKMDDALREENSWLALAGLYWLHEGANTFGSATSNAFVLPEGSAPEHVGTITLHNQEITLDVAASGSVRIDGDGITHAKLEPDSAGSPTFIHLGRLTMVAIQRGERYGIRLWDKRRPQRKSFPGRIWYPIQDHYRVEALFSTYNPPFEIHVSNVLGDVENVTAAGHVTFTLQETDCRLDALGEEESGLFLIFRDLTAEDQTYPSGRFLSTEAPKGDVVTLDFNRAYNPPCAFTRYATCPLPPAQNHLPIRIEAGERYQKIDIDT